MSIDLNDLAELPVGRQLAFLAKENERRRDEIARLTGQLERVGSVQCEGHAGACIRSNISAAAIRPQPKESPSS